MLIYGCLDASSGTTNIFPLRGGLGGIVDRDLDLVNTIDPR